MTSTPAGMPIRKITAKKTSAPANASIRLPRFADYSAIGCAGSRCNPDRPGNHYRPASANRKGRGIAGSRNTPHLRTRDRTGFKPAARGRRHSGTGGRRDGTGSHTRSGSSGSSSPTRARANDRTTGHGRSRRTNRGAGAGSPGTAQEPEPPIQTHLL
jgi:hypothetical protein